MNEKQVDKKLSMLEKSFLIIWNEPLFSLNLQRFSGGVSFWKTNERNQLNKITIKIIILWQKLSL